MMHTVIDDAREQIIPLFLVDGDNHTVQMDTRVFLGTAFFITSRGDAISAAHVLPSGEALPANKRLVAVVQLGKEERVCFVTHAAHFEQWDLALLHVNVIGTKYLALSEQEVIPGADVCLIGIPKHEVWNAGKEMRILKGYVTLTARSLELNMPIPLGMSGSPVFVGQAVVALATGSVRSEAIDDHSESVERVSDTREQILITKVVSLTHYGLAFPLSKLKGLKLPALDGKTLMEFVESQNLLK